MDVRPEYSETVWLHVLLRKLAAQAATPDQLLVFELNTAKMGRLGVCLSRVVRSVSIWGVSLYPPQPITRIDLVRQVKKWEHVCTPIL